MLQKEAPASVVWRFGKDILKSNGMRKERECLQHGQVSVYRHSFMVASMCVKTACLLHIPVDFKSLVRGALLHDYFLYDWHEPDQSHRLHAFFHARCALHNAERDFRLNAIERNMIRAHMFPLNPVFPKYRESIILCIADKLCATGETFSGRFAKSEDLDA